MHVLACLDIWTVEDAVVHGLISRAALKVVRVACVGALARALHGRAGKLGGVPEGRAIEVLLVLGRVALAAGEVEAVAVGDGLARGEVRDRDGVVAGVWTGVCWDGEVDWRREAGRVLQVA